MDGWGGVATVRLARRGGRRGAVDGINVLPLAVTMVVGPQIMSAIIFVTASGVIRASAGTRAGVAPETVGVAISEGPCNRPGGRARS